MWKPNPLRSVSHFHLSIYYEHIVCFNSWHVCCRLCTSQHEYANNTVITTIIIPNCTLPGSETTLCAPYLCQVILYPLNIVWSRVIYNQSTGLGISVLLDDYLIKHKHVWLHGVNLWLFGDDLSSAYHKWSAGSPLRRCPVIVEGVEPDLCMRVCLGVKDRWVTKLLLVFRCRGVCHPLCWSQSSPVTSLFIPL